MTIIDAIFKIAKANDLTEIVLYDTIMLPGFDNIEMLRNLSAKLGKHVGVSEVRRTMNVSTAMHTSIYAFSLHCSLDKSEIAYAINTYKAEKAKHNGLQVSIPNLLDNVNDVSYDAIVCNMYYKTVCIYSYETITMSKREGFKLENL